MNPKEKRNHYNIKFLKGYGHSISVNNSKIILKDCHDLFSKGTTEEWFVKNMPYQRIVLSGKGYISTEALSLLSESNRTVILLDTYGNPVTFLEPVRSSLTASQYRMGQYDTFRDKKKCEYLTKQILKAKLESQIRFLKSTNNSDIKQGIIKLEKSGLSEAVSSRFYFENYSKLIDERFQFTKRNSIQIAKNNATDVINALLNYGYSVLAGQISSYINGVGLDTYYGFMHKNHTSFQSLVYDMMEPFRWLVDSAVCKMSDAKSKNRISKKQYAYTRQGNVVLEYDLIRNFLELLERNFQRVRRFEYRHGAFTKDGLKSVKEITIAKIMVQNLAEFCIDKKATFLI